MPTRKVTSPRIAGLDLTLLATGGWQHVFVRTGTRGDPWVYKIPAAFGFTLSTDHPLAFIKPRSPSEKMLDFILLGVPNRIHAPRMIGARLLGAYHRHVRMIEFRKMLKVVEYLRDAGLDATILPCEILREEEALLRVQGRTTRYVGPMLVQRRADFFDEFSRLTSFDWNEPVGAQKRLWRQGVALSGERTVLAPVGWAKLEGHLRLADTSSLTTNYDLAVATLRDERLDMLQARVLGQIDSPRLRASVRRYFEFVRKEINQGALLRLWRSDLTPPKRSYQTV